MKMIRFLFTTLLLIELMREAYVELFGHFKNVSNSARDMSRSRFSTWKIQTSNGTSLK